MIDKLSEAIIRGALLRNLRARHENSVNEEVKIEGGTARIDVVSFSPELVGYEIKSDFDNFDRMTNQIHAYNRVFSKIYLVCGQRHMEYALAILPSWWGIMQVLPEGDNYRLQIIREARSHDRQDSYSMASLLSRRSALELLSIHHSHQRPRASLRTIWEALATHVPMRSIEEAIIQERTNGFSVVALPLL